MKKRILIAGLAICAGLAAAETWRIDNLESIGGHPATVLGHPIIVPAPGGKALEFNGINDAVFLNVHPLAAAKTWTWEVIFRPASGGAPEQRFFHLQEDGSDNRMLFEIRVIGNQWCLDAFVKSGDVQQVLLDRTRLHSLDTWHHAAAVYDGHQFRNYVDGVLEGSAEIHLEPQKAGQTSLGVRINKVNFFKGAILRARMTPRALSPQEFLKKP